MHFIQTFDLVKQTDLWIQVRHIVSFRPAADPTKTTINMINGETHNVNMTPAVVALEVTTP